MNNGIFNSPTKGQLDLESVVEEINRFVAEDTNATYKLVIGTDSQERKNGDAKTVDFVTAVVVHRRGKGGRYFWQKKQKRKVTSLRDKIYQETVYSLDMAQFLVPRLKESLAGLAPYDLEIHIDVGEVGPTREMIKEVVGMVTGSGYVAKTKPEAYGAATVADKHT